MSLAEAVLLCNPSYDAEGYINKEGRFAEAPFLTEFHEIWLFCKCWGLANQQVFLAPNTIVFGAVLFAQQ